MSGQTDTISNPHSYTPEPYDIEKPDLRDAAEDGPFGSEENAEIKYRTLAWWQCGIIMVAETISLGILSLPSALAKLGMVPGVVIILGVSMIATYTGYVLGQFKQRHPGVHSMADAGEILWGPIGREVLGLAQLILMVFNMSSHVLTFSVMLNTVTEHGTCSIAFGICGMIVCFIGNLPRTLRNVSWMSFASFASIFAAVMITMIAIGIQRPAAGQVQATTATDLNHAFLGVTNIIFGYVGNFVFFSFISEMKVPSDYPKALFLLQSTDTMMYIVAAVVIYYYGGKSVTSPALGSTGPLISKIAYGVAIPTIVVAGVINGHVACKYIYVRVFRGTEHMHKRNLFSTGSWVLIAFVLWAIAWVISEAIPVFNDLLSLMTSLFASWFTFSICGVFWLYLNQGIWFSSPRKIFLTIINLIIILIGGLVCGLGLYVSGKSIHDNPSGASFSCANNA